MKRVIENGNQFTEGHFYMMLQELNYEHIGQTVARYLKIIVEELNLSEGRFTEFCNS